MSARSSRVQSIQRPLQRAAAPRRARFRDLSSVSVPCVGRCVAGGIIADMSIKVGFGTPTRQSRCRDPAPRRGEQQRPLLRHTHSGRSTHARRCGPRRRSRTPRLSLQSPQHTQVSVYGLAVVDSDRRTLQRGDTPPRRRSHTAQVGRAVRVAPRRLQRVPDRARGRHRELTLAAAARAAGAAAGMAAARAAGLRAAGCLR